MAAARAEPMDPTTPQGAPQRHDERNGCVVHVSGAFAEAEVERLLWPAVLTLAQAGARQSVLLLDPADATRARQLLPRDVDLVVLTSQRPQWSSSEALAALRERLGAEGVIAVHLHGELARRLGLKALDSLPHALPVFLHEPSSPPSSLQRWWRRWAPSPASHALVVRSGRIEPALPRGERPGAPPEVVSLAPFLSLPRHEAGTPMVVTTARRNDFAAANAFAQLAVLFAGSVPRVRFVWLGEAGPSVAAVLQAAQVQQVRARRPAERAGWLAQAWLYVAPAGRDHEARGLVEAMAAGVPCVARDGMALADCLMIDQLSGFVCDDQQSVLRRIAQLIDDRALRERVGAAARQRARLHHGQDRFRARLLLAHGLPVREPQDAGLLPLGLSAPPP
jgi:glycosyltransferase involved in cell wall biosynthesis